MQRSTSFSITRLGWFAYAVAVLVIVLDQLSKYWILHVFDLPSKGSWPVTGFFNLTMVWNRGVSFGLFRADADIGRWALAAFSFVVALVLIGWARASGRLLQAVALGLVIGGALGNLIDRVRFAAVADFLDFNGLWFPWIFNVADSGITVGIALLLLDGFIPHRPKAA